MPPVGGPALDVVQQESRPSRVSPRLQELFNARRGQNVSGIAYHVREQRAEPLDLMWEISAGSESLVLLHCH